LTGVEPENDILDYLGSGQYMGVNLTYIVQDEKLDLVNAIYAVRYVVGNSTFAVILVDNFFYAKTFIQGYSRLS